MFLFDIKTNHYWNAGDKLAINFSLRGVSSRACLIRAQPSAILVCGINRDFLGEENTCLKIRIVGYKRLEDDAHPTRFARIKNGLSRVIPIDVFYVKITIIFYPNPMHLFGTHKSPIRVSNRNAK